MSNVIFVKCHFECCVIIYCLVFIFIVCLFLFLILNVIFSHDRSLFIFNRVLFFCFLGLIIQSPLLKPILFASDQAQTQAKIGPKPRPVWPAQLPKQTSQQAYRPTSFLLHGPCMTPLPTCIVPAQLPPRATTRPFSTDSPGF